MTDPSAAPDEYTVSTYAGEKNLPADWLRDAFDLAENGAGEIEIPYHDLDGDFVCAKYRSRDGFRFAKGSDPTLYGLERLPDADPDEPVLLVEGESDVHACALYDVLALGVPGASGWRSEWAEHLDGRDVFVWREPDAGGETLVRDVADDLPDARVIEAPDDAEDVADLHVAAPAEFDDRLRRLMDDAGPVDSDDADGADLPHDADAPQKLQLVQLASGADVFTDERDTAYARMEQDGHLETWRLEGERFRSWLAHRYFREHNGVPSSSILTDAIQVLSGRALFDGPTRELGNRIAWHDGDLWYDMAGDEWRAVRVGPGEWEIVERPPALFRRYAHQSAQMEPAAVAAERLPEMLGPFLNLDDEDTATRRLIYVWTVTALVAGIPRPVLVPHGPQGSAKSVLTRMLRALVDPSSVPIPTFPTNRRDLAQALDHNAVVGLDNVGTLSRSMSDTLCRAVTGGGFSKRKLYSDEEDVLFQFCRAVVLNGINVPATQPDLLDRSVLVPLERIPDDERRDEDALKAEFRAARPRMFGAMLDALAQARVILPDLNLDRLPRMADWTRWGFAVAEALGIDGETFRDAYRENREARNEMALRSHPVGAAMLALMRGRGEWTGTARDLLDDLERVARREGIDTTTKLWPGGANWVSRRINEVRPNLSDAGIRWEPEWKWDDDRGKVVRLVRSGGSG